MNRLAKIVIGIGIGIVAACLIGLIVTGWQIGWGPFRFLFKGYEGQVRAIEQKYDAETRKGEIVFYGASNFRLWKEMEDDFKEYKVQNHAFGGSTDPMLVEYADRLLFPYEPAIVVFQTGSNDFASMIGSDEAMLNASFSRKVEMFDAFHERLPNAKFLVMSGLLLPGRSQYIGITQRLNEKLEALCEQRDYMYFADASALTFDGDAYAEERFINDRIHLTHDARLLWCSEYIRPQLELIIQEYQLDVVRK